MSKKQIQSNLLLLTTALIWGFAFVAQRAGMEYIGPFMYTALRFTLGALTLLPVIFIFDRINAKADAEKVSGQGEAVEAALQAPTGEAAVPKSPAGQTVALRKRKDTLKAGIICGIILFCGASLQQIGLIYTSAGKTGFITALYIVIVPLLSVVLKKKIRLNAWISVLIAAVGFYFLCIKSDFSISMGDLIVLAGSSFWAAHILVIDHFIDRVDPIRLSAIQFAAVAAVAYVVAAVTETTTLSSIIDAAGTLAFAGILSCGVGFTFQILGQKHAAPTAAALILSLESVFAVIGGALILSEILSARELIGCILVFGAVILSQLPSKPSKITTAAE